MKDYSKIVEANADQHRNVNPLGPKWPFRMLMCGGSGCGKTNTLLNLILDNYVCFDKIFLYAKNLNQDKYKFLIDKIHEAEKAEGVPEGTFIYAKSKISDVIELANPEDEEESQSEAEKLAKVKQNAKLESLRKINNSKGASKGKGKASTAIAAAAASSLPSLSKMCGAKVDPKKQNLVIFDDFVSEKNQHIIENYFIGSRHHNCSCIYLSQSYYSTPKNIRLNCTHFCIWEIASDRELVELCKDHSGGEPRFKELFYASTKFPFHFFFIDKFTKDRRLKFRVNFGVVPIGQQEINEEAVDDDDTFSDEDSEELYRQYRQNAVF